MNSCKIDATYAQTGAICVFASYAIIMKYFSQNRKDICELIGKYVQVFGTNPTTESILDIENSVHRHYHAYCTDNKIRGFHFIACKHKKNYFLTFKYSTSVQVVVNDGSIDRPLHRRHNEALKRNLKKGGLAMILIDKMNHTIVVGFDKRKGGYFYRNPTRSQGKVLVREDFLKDNDVYEYILFERNKYKIKALKAEFKY
jgi:hypothetical protein